MSLIIFSILAVLALWVADTLMKKNGIYFFSIVAITVSAYFAPVSIFGLAVNAQVVIIPALFYALLLTYFKYGSAESIRLFYVSIISVAVMFILRFFELGLLDIFDDESVYISYFSWANLKDYVANLVAYALCCIGGYFFVKFVTLQKLHQILKVAIYLVIFTAVNSLIFVIISAPSFLSFGDAILVFLTMLMFDVILSFILGCYDFLTNKNGYYVTGGGASTYEEEPKYNHSEKAEKKVSDILDRKSSSPSESAAASRTPTSSSASSSAKSSTSASTSTVTPNPSYRPYSSTSRPTYTGTSTLNSTTATSKPNTSADTTKANN